MWKKRTEQELAEVERQARRNWKLGAVLLGAIFAALLIFTRGRSWSRYHASPLVSWEEVPARIPSALACGGVAGWLFYRFKKGPKRTMICPHCDKARRDDGVIRCACGRDFVDIKTLKWVS
jgi:hypothetical protein